jgi:hypothetical protein
MMVQSNNFACTDAWDKGREIALGHSRLLLGPPLLTEQIVELISNCKDTQSTIIKSTNNVKTKVIYI